MLNTTTLKTNELDKQLKDKAFVAVMVICAVSWAGFMGDGTSNMLLGAVLVGLNLVRRQSGIAMGKASFMIGAFLFSLGFLEGATLYNPLWLPLLGLMIAANAIFNGLSKDNAAAA